MKKVRTFELHGVAAELMRFIHKDDPIPNSPRWPDGHPRELKWFLEKPKREPLPQLKENEPPPAPVYLIAQELANGLIGTKIEYDNAFPHFVLVPNCLLTCSLGIGDFFTPGKLQADDRFAVLASNVTEMTKERKLWINPNSSILAVQATVIDIKSKY
ncbi:hypothetical protein niasHT_014570 [Heterodera trifolii]|uniref:Uncharacterized protein n=1 Tax=Heterodera trifolii TaxID=157864 RepID=A0ABD2LHQ8_9BILA